MPILGVFFSLRREAVWVVFCSSGMDWVTATESLGLVAEGHALHWGFHSWLPAADSHPGAVEFSPQKEQLGLSLPVPHLDQSLGTSVVFQLFST